MLVLSAACAFGQQDDSRSSPAALDGSQNNCCVNEPPPLLLLAQTSEPETSKPHEEPAGQPDQTVLPNSKAQPKRILGIMPNYRAVSADDPAAGHAQTGI